MIKVAVIGAGKMGLLHASILNITPGVKLTAICEKSPLIRRILKNALPKISVVAKIEELHGIGLDAVYITTPMSSHHAIIKTILVENICRNIFVEKPLASSHAESRELRELTNRSGLAGVNLVGYNRRYGVTFKKAREIISEGWLGQPRYFEAYAYSSDFQFVSEENKKMSRGGVLRDLGCHALDLAAWYMGQMNTGSLKLAKIPGDNPVDTVDFEISAETGISGEIKASWCQPDYRLPEIGFVLEGLNTRKLIVNEDKVELRDANGEVEVWYKQDLGDNAFFMLGGTDYYREDEEYISAIKNGEKIKPGFETAAHVDEIIEKVENLYARREHAR